MNGTNWTPSEDNALRTFYPKHGPSWDGWDEVLPDRSNESIRCRATRLRLTKPQRTADGQLVRGRKGPSRHYAGPVDPREHDVVTLMHAGWPPSRIDAHNGWEDGTARKLVTRRWLRIKEGK